MPATLDGYRLTRTSAFKDPRLGTAYRFAGPPDENVTVFVYSIADDVRANNDVQALVTAEGEKFRLVFPVGVRRGWYQSYRFVFAHPEPLTIEKVAVPGFVAAAATKKGERISVEMEYVYAVCDAFLKVRGTLDRRTWSESEFPTFVKDLVAHQVRRQPAGN